MKLGELRVYELAMDIGERVWDVVAVWDYFAKDTVGKQLVKAADSVTANLSEGFGRFHYRETRQFGYYSRGSLFETRTWLNKACSRGLIAADVHAALIHDIDNIGIRLNNYIKSVGAGSREARETPGAYLDTAPEEWDHLPELVQQRAADRGATAPNDTNAASQ